MSEAPNDERSAAPERDAHRRPIAWNLTTRRHLPPPRSVSVIDEDDDDQRVVPAWNPPHPALDPIRWQRWPGFALRMLAPPAAHEAPRRQVPAFAPPRLLPPPPPDAHRMPAPLAAAPLVLRGEFAATHRSSHEADLPEPTGAPSNVTELRPADPIPTRQRHPFWGWAAAGIVGLMVGIAIAPQRNDRPQLATADVPSVSEPAIGGGAGSGATAGSAADSPPATASVADPSTADVGTPPTSVVAQLPPPVPANGETAPITLTTQFAGAGNDEWIRLVNDGPDPIDLGGWTIGDDGRMHLYVFDAFVLDAGSAITLSTGCGSDTPTDRFWCLDGEVWDDTGDAATVVDADGRLVATASATG